jgi:hypothetical protein
MRVTWSHIHQSYPGAFQESVKAQQHHKFSVCVNRLAHALCGTVYLLGNIGSASHADRIQPPCATIYYWAHTQGKILEKTSP